MPITQWLPGVSQTGPGWSGLNGRLCVLVSGIAAAGVRKGGANVQYLYNK